MGPAAEVTATEVPSAAMVTVGRVRAAVARAREVEVEVGVVDAEGQMLGTRSSRWRGPRYRRAR